MPTETLLAIFNFARHFIACHKFDLDLVFKVTMIIESFEKNTNCHLWVWKIFISSVDTYIKKLPNMHDPDQFFTSVKVSAEMDKLKWKSMRFHTNRDIF